MRRLRATCALFRDVGFRLLLVAQTLERDDDVSQLMAAVEADEYFVVRFEARPDTLAARIVARESASWSGLPGLVAHARKLAETPGRPSGLAGPATRQWPQPWRRWSGTETIRLVSEADAELLRGAWDAFTRGDVDAAVAAFDPHARWYAAGEPGDDGCHNRDDAVRRGARIADVEGNFSTLLVRRSFSAPRTLEAPHFAASLAPVPAGATARDPNTPT
jgi:hypothetical protein